MKTRFAFALLLGLMACSNELVVPAPAEVSGPRYDSHPKHAIYQKALEGYVSRTASPGGVLLVDRPGEALWIGSTGKSNLEHRTDFHSRTQFRTGSVTKMLTAVVTMKLIEQERFTLESSLASTLPETKGQIPQAEKITVRHLLAHLSGLVDPPNDNLGYQSALINDPRAFFELSTRDLLKQYVFGKKLKFAPGTSHYYSNVNYWLLGLIAERATGRPLPELMDKLIFQPVGMTNSFLTLQDDRHVARGYADLYRNGVLTDVTLWDRAEGDGQADGGLITTAEDLQKFMRALFAGPLVSTSMRNEMKRVQQENCNSPECEYGLGVELYRTPNDWAYGHSGSLVGIEASALYYESSGSIVVMYKNHGEPSDKGYLNALGN